MTLRESDERTLSVVLEKYQTPGSIPHSFDQPAGRVYKTPGEFKSGKNYDTMGTMYRYQYVNLVRPYDSPFAHSHDMFDDISLGRDHIDIGELRYIHGDESGAIAYEDDEVDHLADIIISRERYNQYFQETYPKILKHRIRRWKSSRNTVNIPVIEGRDYEKIYEDDNVCLTLTLTRTGHQRTLQGTCCCTADRETAWFYDNMTTGWGLSFITAKFKNNKNIATKACLISQKYQYIDDKKIPLRIYTDNIGETLTCKKVIDHNGVLIQDNPREEKLGLILDNKEIGDCLDRYLSESTLSNSDD